jgi:hypothetical protein
LCPGIAAAGKVSRGAGKPIPLPVQALDHATGYLHTMVTKFETVSNLSIDARSLCLPGLHGGLATTRTSAGDMIVCQICCFCVPSALARSRKSLRGGA